VCVCACVGVFVCMCVCVCMYMHTQGGARETQRHRDIETQRHRDTEEKRKGEKEKERKRERETERQRGREIVPLCRSVSLLSVFLSPCVSVYLLVSLSETQGDRNKVPSAPMHLPRCSPSHNYQCRHRHKETQVFLSPLCRSVSQTETQGDRQRHKEIDRETRR